MVKRKAGSESMNSRKLRFVVVTTLLTVSFGVASRPAEAATYPANEPCAAAATAW